MLRIDHIAKRYREQQVLRGIDLNVEAGEFVSLLGPSGCGKTTLLRIVCGIDMPDEGRVLFQGDDITRWPAARRGFGVVFQSYALFPNLTAAQNVAFGLNGQPAAQARERVAEMLSLVGLGAQAQRYPAQLSGGQQQRVALARALAPSPQLMLLDEPFSNLDVDLRERLAHEVRGILKAAGATALFVTHDQLEAFAIGDMIGVVHQGQLQQWDDAYSLYHRPATRFVADFIGHGVFVPATLAPSGAGGVVARTALGDLVDPATCPLPAQFADGECDVLLRADDVVHDDASPVQARILRKAFRGSEFLYTLELASGHSVLAHVPSHHDHAVGEWVGIRLDMNHVVAFPRERQGTAQTAAA